MNFILIISFLFAILFFPSVYGKRKLISGSRGDGIFSDFRLTHDWKLQKSIQCPQNEYAIGASIRTSNIPNSKVTSISAFRLQCSDRIRGKSFTSSLQVGKFYKETSDWQAPQECARGFVVGVSIFVNPKPKDESSEMETGNYVSGIKLVCQNGQWAAISNQTVAFSSSVRFGLAIGKELEIICALGRVTNSIGVGLKSVIMMEEGESLYPSELGITCSAPRHPFVGCKIELEFEPVSDFKCRPYAERDYSLVDLIENSTLGVDAEKISCYFSTLKGAKLNEDISNLKDITFSYETTGIKTTNGSWMAYLALLKMEELKFKVEWINVLGKDVPQLDAATRWYSFERLSEHKENFTLFDTSPRKTMTFVNLAEFRLNNKATLPPDVKLTHSIKIEQLVGYCSVFKLYFPLVRKDVSGFVKEKRERISKIFQFV